MFTQKTYTFLSKIMLRLRPPSRFLGSVDAMLTMLSHSFLHSSSEYTNPASEFSLVCCHLHRLHNDSRHSLPVINPWRALRNVSKRSWKPHMPNSQERLLSINQLVCYFIQSVLNKHITGISCSSIHPTMRPCILPLKSSDIKKKLTYRSMLRDILKI
jgi:hypothetical protein